MFADKQKIRNLEYEVTDLKRKYWAMENRLNLLVYRLGYYFEDVQPETVLKKKVENNLK